MDAGATRSCISSSMLTLHRFWKAVTSSGSSTNLSRGMEGPGKVLLPALMRPLLAGKACPSRAVCVFVTMCRHSDSFSVL